MNASELRNATPPPPPFAPSDAVFAADYSPAPFYITNEDVMGQFRLIVQVLAVVAMAASLGAATVTIVLVITVKRLQLLIGVLRNQTRTEGVRAGLLEADAAELDAPAKNGGARGAAAGGGGGKKKTRRQQTDTENTSCALEGVDEEDDHRL